MVNGNPNNLAGEGNVILNLVLQPNEHPNGIPGFDAFARRGQLSGAQALGVANKTFFSLEASEPRRAGARGKTAWWRWTAPVTGLVTIDTLASDFNTTLTVYVGDSFANLSEVENVKWSEVNLTAHQGVRYEIVVDGYPNNDAGDGNIVLLVDQTQSLTTQGPTVMPRPDFNSDFLSDLLLQDDSGSIGFWSMRGANLSTAGSFSPVSVGDASWKLVGCGDFNGNGTPDLVFQHEKGQVALWSMSGSIMQSLGTGFTDPKSPGSGWQVVAVADFNSDGKPDLLFQHTDGSLAVWMMDGLKLSTALWLVPNSPGDASWRVVGSGDFNNDGKPDLLFQHSDGRLAIWFMDGVRLVSGKFVNPLGPSDPQWRVVSIVDLDLDGKPDLIFQNRHDNSMVVWFMDSSKLRQASFLNPSQPGGSWKVAGPK